MVDFMITAVLLIVVGAAVIYIVEAKKRGAKCIGCPDSGSCPHAGIKCTCNTDKK